MNVCRKCEAENSAGAKFCQMCGAPLGGADAADPERAIGKPDPSLSTTEVFSTDAAEPRICPVCDAANERGWSFCQQCGSKLSNSPVDQEAVQKAGPPKPYATTVRSKGPGSEVKRASASGAPNCPQCSELIVMEAAFCPKCGSGVHNVNTVAMSSMRATTKARLVLIVDGEDTGNEYDIKSDTVIGRTDGGITFPHDDYMSGRHARIAKRGDKFTLIDEDSRNGSFIRIKKQVDLQTGDYVLLGKQLFRFEVE
jgi:predicted amidophosphoribosyltransferase